MNPWFLMNEGRKESIICVFDLSLHLPLPSALIGCQKRHNTPTKPAPGVSSGSLLEKWRKRITEAAG